MSICYKKIHFSKKGIFEIDFGIGFGVNKYNDTGDKNYYKKLIDEKIASLGKKRVYILKHF